MKKVLFFISIILSVFSANAQINTYEWESAGYFTSFLLNITKLGEFFQSSKHYV